MITDNYSHLNFTWLNSAKKKCQVCTFDFSLLNLQVALFVFLFEKVRIPQKQYPPKEFMSSFWSISILGISSSIISPPIKS